MGVNDRGGLMPSVMAPSIVDQVVTVAATSAQSLVLDPKTAFVRVSSDVNCAIKFGNSPTALASSMRLAAGSTEYFGVPAGVAMKIAVIAIS